MTNLTFAELTALMAVNGLVINDRYFITDKNWTIIAISTSTYRIVVPIVTEVTKAELDALVAADGLNEGLQYKVTDKNWLVIAKGVDTYSFSGSVPYFKIVALLNSTPTFSALILENECGTITFGRQVDPNPGEYILDFTDFSITLEKVYSPPTIINYSGDLVILQALYNSSSQIVLQATYLSSGLAADEIILYHPIEIRIYF